MSRPASRRSRRSSFLFLAYDILAPYGTLKARQNETRTAAYCPLIMSKMRSRGGRQPNRRLAVTAIALAGALALSGCGSTIGKLPLIGEPKGAPPAPDVTPATPSIGARPQRPDKALTPAELQKAQAELNTARTQGPDERRKKIKEPASP
jgi:hypothetical protein